MGKIDQDKVAKFGRWRQILLLSLGALLVACSSHSVQPLLEAGQHVHVVGVSADVDKLHAETKSEAATKDMRRGMFGAAGEGALQSGRCGIGVIVCFPLFVLVGGTAGAIQGHNWGTKVGLSDEHAKALNVIANRMRTADDLESRLVQAVSSCNGNRVGDSSAARTQITVQVRLTEADLLQLPNEMIRLALVARMAVIEDPEGVAIGHGPFEYRFTSDPLSAEAWIRSDGEQLSAEINRGFAQLASGMAWTLWGPGAVRRDSTGTLRCHGPAEEISLSSTSADPTISQLERERVP